VKEKQLGKLDDRDNQIAIRLRKRVVRITPIIRMVIFGLRARGDPEHESDKDVFIEYLYWMLLSIEK
jgi:predicted nucleotidyltransferase